MLRTLYERGIAPDLIVGTSVGALNGAFIASRPATPTTALELAEIWHKVGRWTVFPLNPLTGLFGFLGARDHFVSDRGVKSLVRRELGIENLEDFPVSLHVIATDLLSGKELRLSQGDAFSAVIASTAIPGVFPAVEREGRLLMDGGVANNTPIAHAIELGAERIFVLPTGNACDLSEAPRGAIAMLLHAMSLLIMRRLLMEIEMLRDRAELIILPPPCPLSVAPIDFSHSKELIARGYEGSSEYLHALEEGRAQAPVEMSMHSHQRGDVRSPSLATRTNHAAGTR